MVCIFGVEPYHLYANASFTEFKSEIPNVPQSIKPIINMIKPT